MGATFPNGIASFTEKRDQYDPVDAADVNKLQAEVVAIEETLGDALTSLQIIESDISVLQDEETTDSSTDKSILKKFASLKELVSTLWEGQNIYTASASSGNQKLGTTTNWNTPDLINLAKPAASHDPMGMWNGTGFTLPKSGFWVAQGSVYLNLPAPGVGGMGSTRSGATSPKDSLSLRVGSFNVNQFDSGSQIADDLEARLDSVDVLMLQESVNLDAKSFADAHPGWDAFQVNPNENDGHSNTSILYRKEFGPVQETACVFTGVAGDTRKRYLTGIRLHGTWYVSVHLFPERDEIDNTGVLNNIRDWSAAHPAPQIWGLDKNQVDVNTMENVTGLKWSGVDIDGFLTGNGAAIGNVNAFPPGHSDHDGVHATANIATKYTGGVRSGSGSGSTDSNFGMYLASIAINKTNWSRSFDTTYVTDKGQSLVALNPVLAGWYPKGTRLTLRALQTSNRSQNVTNGHLSVYRMRGW